MIIRKFCDLDNTLIFSHRRELKSEKIAVEYLNGGPQSFMPIKTYGELQKQGPSSIIPLSSRTLNQYNRINLFNDGKKPEYALVDNGGILLVNGIIDEVWMRETFKLISGKYSRMKCLLNDLKSLGEVKLQDDLILFLKSNDVDIMSKLRYIRDEFIVFNHMSKIYICPSELRKGEAIKRFISVYGGDMVFSAGDSIVDCSMIDYSDICYLSNELEGQVKKNGKVNFFENEELGMVLLSEKF